MQTDALLSVLPPFERKRDILVYGDQSLQQIITEVLNAHVRYSPDYDKIAGMFSGYAPRKLFDFVQRNIPYKEQSGKDQNTKSPAAILSSNHPSNDCKHYAGFIAGVLDAINRSGKDYYDWYYRFANYEKNKPYDHVYVIVGDDLAIDPTPIRQSEGKYIGRTFNDRKLEPVDYRDLKPATMLSSIHGVHYTVTNDTPGSCCNGAYIGQTGTTNVSSDILGLAQTDPAVAGVVDGAKSLASVLPDGSLKDWVNDFLSDPAGAVKTILTGRTYNTGNYKLGEVYMRNILGMEQIQRNTQVPDKYVPQAWAFFTAAMGVPVGSIDHLDQLVTGRDAYKTWANGTFNWVPDDQVDRAHTILNQYIGWTSTYYPRDTAWNLNQFAAIPYIYPIWAVWDGSSPVKKFTGKHPITGLQINDGFPTGVSSSTATNASGCAAITVTGPVVLQGDNLTGVLGKYWYAFYPMQGTNIQGSNFYGPDWLSYAIDVPNGHVVFGGVSTQVGDFSYGITLKNDCSTVAIAKTATIVSTAAQLPASGNPTVTKAGFGLIPGLVFVGLAGGLLYAANKKKHVHR